MPVIGPRAVGQAGGATAPCQMTWLNRVAAADAAVLVGDEQMCRVWLTVRVLPRRVVVEGGQVSACVFRPCVPHESGRTGSCRPWAERRRAVDGRYAVGDEQ